MSIEQIDQLIREEKFEAAVAAATGNDPGVVVRRARLLGRRNRCDDALLALLPVIDGDAGARLPADERADAFGLAGQLYAWKRCRNLARARLAMAREKCGADDPRVLLAIGRVELHFDERDAARAAIESAHGRLQNDETYMAMADIAHVEGDFAKALQFLDRIGDGEWTVRALRLRASTCAAENDFAGEATAWKRVVERVPASDRKSTDWLNLGFALAAQGRRAEAITELRALWQADPDSDIGRYARSRAETLEKAAATAQRKVLVFPTTQQKYCYCGPAVIELCLRSLGIELTQDEIAAKVKRESGTPMFEIVRFLDECGIVARRIVATETKIRAAIDLGLPVIVQEEYSTTSHVAVMTGYDEALGILVVHDPMTHRTSTRAFGWTERAGGLFGNGGVLVLGRKGDASESERAAQATAAGLVDAEHLRLVDDTSRRRANARDVERASPEEVLASTKRAIELEPRYRLAWYMRVQAREEIARRNRDDKQARNRMLADLYHVRTAFPDDEWPCQLHARWLLDERQHSEAFAAYHDAHRRDRSDGNNIAWMACCKWYTGKLVDAEKYLVQSLELDAQDGLREGSLAGIYLRELEALDAAADDDDDDGDTFAMPVAVEFPKTIEQRVKHDRDELVRRALHFIAIACELQPNNPWNHETAGMLFARAGTWAEAERTFGVAHGQSPGRWYARVGLACAREAAGKRDDARQLFEEGTAKWPRDPDAWLLLGAHHARGADHAAAVATFASGIEKAASGRERFVDPLWDALVEIGTREEAAARLRELANAQSGDADLLWEAASHLDDHHQRGHAIGLLRAAVAAKPDHVSAIGKLGAMLAEDWLTRDEGRTYLEKALEQAPDWPHVRRQLALHHVTGDAEQGLRVLEPALAEDAAWTHEVHAMTLEALGRADDAARATRRAIAAFDGASDYAIRSFCNWHRGANRYDRAMYWARRIFEFPVAPDKLSYAQSSWLATHRLAGRVREILPQLRELCANGVPGHLAWETYYAMQTIDRAIAAEAAKVEQTRLDDPSDVLVWRIHEAEQRAHLGDTTQLDAIVAELGEDVEAWAQLAWAYSALERWDDANRAATRTYELDPEESSALTVMLELHLRKGDVDAALALATRSHQLHPYVHTGPERLALIHAKSMRADDALRFAVQAVDAAPYCHVAQEAHALALFVAGKHDEARRRAQRALALEEPDEPDPANDALMIVRALDKDRAGVERCLAKRDRSHPPTLFAEYRAYLLTTAG